MSSKVFETNLRIKNKTRSIRCGLDLRRSVVPRSSSLVKFASLLYSSGRQDCLRPAPSSPPSAILKWGA